MNSIFHNKLNEFMIIYKDDILVDSKFTKEHATHVEFMLQKFKKNKLYINRAKNEKWVQKCIFWDMYSFQKGWGLTQKRLNQLKNGKAQCQPKV